MITCQDAIYFLGEALRRGVIDCEVRSCWMIKDDCNCSYIIACWVYRRACHSTFHPVPHQHMTSRWSSCLHIILSLINIISIVILIAGFPKTCQTALQATIHSQVNHALYYNFQCHSLSLINTFSLHALKYHQSILPHLFLKGDNAQGSSDGLKVWKRSALDLWSTQFCEQLDIDIVTT